MVHEIKIDVSGEVVGADQRKLLGHREIAEIEKAEIAEANKNSSRARIYGCIEIPFRLGGAIGIRRRLYARNGLDVFAVSRENDDAEAGDVDGVTGMHGAARCSADGFDVSRIVGRVMSESSRLTP